MSVPALSVAAVTSSRVEQPLRAGAKLARGPLYVAVAAITTLVASLLSIAATATTARADVVRDGTTAATALASCWDVKQNNPAAPSGQYWLYTPGLQYPQQFYCDMVTDGGGWVLIGRGREGWSFLEAGQNTSAVNYPAVGTAAFAPAHFSGATVRGLLNDAPVTSLNGGIRLRRATDYAGTRYQDARMYPSTMQQWRWTLNGNYPLSKSTYSGTAVAGGTTANAGTGTWSAVIGTQKLKLHNWLSGFAYGKSVIGQANSTSHLWSPSNGGYAIPFTQMYIRPTVRWDDLGAVNPAAQTKDQVMRNLAEPQPAGVSGLANGRSGERNTEVRAMAQVGTTMFVGGNFARVDNYATRTTTAQPYLAAFNVTSGAHLPSFVIRLNGQVNALAKLPNGMLAVGGEFTTVNGKSQPGLVVLNPTSGAVVSSFTASLIFKGSTGSTPGVVNGLAVSGNYLYVAGKFTHIAGGGAGYAYTKMGARLNAGTGRPDYQWNPAFNGTPLFVTVSASGDRAYFGGFMTAMNDGANAAKYFAAVTTSVPAQPVSGLRAPVYSAAWTTYQQTGVEVGDRFWLGGSEHSFFMYDKANLNLLRGNIAMADNTSGGDFQASAVDGGVVYGSCHCILSSNYGSGKTWPKPTGFDDVDSMRYIAAYDANTGRQLQSFVPEMKTRAVRGPWSMTVDSNQCLWAGGDTTSTKSTAGGWQSSGGFSRWCHEDSVAPPMPSKPVPSTSGGTTTVKWTGVQDNSGKTVFYILYRNNVPVWRGYSWKTTLPATPGASYTLRAQDSAGNLSAITTAATG